MDERAMVDEGAMMEENAMTNEKTIMDEQALAAEQALMEERKGEADAVYGKYLTVMLGDQYYCIPVAHVVQIVGVQQIVSVPEFPYYAKGIINLRGVVIPVIDARLRLGLSEEAYTDRTCIIITNVFERSVGFIVDSVDEVTDISDEMILPMPHDMQSGFLNGVCKRGTKVVLRLVLERMAGGQEDAVLFQMGV